MIELWPILMRKTAITTTFYFTEEEENIRKKGKGSSNGHDLDANFFNTCNDFHMEEIVVPLVSKTTEKSIKLKTSTLIRKN